MKKMIALIKGFFAKDLILKIFSLVLAIALWFVVMNTLNPTETKSFTTDLTFFNEAALKDSELTIINKKDLENTKVTIKVKGTRPALDELSKPKNRTELNAYVDLKQLSAVELENSPQGLSLAVTPKLPDNIFIYSYEIVSCSPNVIEASVDKLKSETMKLQIDVNGQLKSGYNAGEPICETDTVRITGPSSMFNRVSSVKAGIDINGKTSDINVSVAPAVYDTDGVPMELFTVEPSVIDIALSINRHWQIPVKAPEIVGELNENLVLKSVEFEPKSIEVEGNIEDINKVDSIQVPSINLADIEHTQTLNFDVRPSLRGTDLQLKEGTPNEVRVTVSVNSKATKDITITNDDFDIKGLDGKLSANINDVNITLYGAQELLDSLNAKQLKPVIDLSGRGTGWHNIDFTLTLPENVQMRVEPSARVFIRSADEPPTVEPVTEIESESEAQPSTEIAVEVESDEDKQEE